MDIHTKFDIGDYAYVKDEDKPVLVRIVGFTVHCHEYAVKSNSIAGAIDDRYYIVEFCDNKDFRPIGYAMYEPYFMECDLYTKDEIKPEEEISAEKHEEELLPFCGGIRYAVNDC